MPRGERAPLVVPLDREIARLAVPALGALVAEPLYILVDTAIIGHLGTAQLGGLAIAGTILTTGFWLFNFLAYGTTAAVARHVGAGDDAGAGREALHALALAVVLGIAVACVGWMVAGPMVGLAAPPDDVRSHALTYLRISWLGAPAVLIALAGAGYLRGLQDTKTTLVVAVAANVVNLMVELVFVYGFGWGVAGSAWATVLAQAGAAAYFAWSMLRDVRASGARLAIEVRRLRALAVTSRDLLIRTGSLLGALALATAVASRMGRVPLAAHQISFQLWGLLALVLDALAIAGQAMTGRLLGARLPADAAAAARRMLRWGVFAGAVFSIVVASLSQVLPRVFTDDPAVRAMASQVLLVVALLQPLNAVVFVLDGVLIGAGDARYLGRAMLLASAAVFVPAVIAVRALDLGLVALWVALSLLMVARLIGVGTRFARGRWQVVGLRLGR